MFRKNPRKIHETGKSANQYSSVSQRQTRSIRLLLYLFTIAIKPRGTIRLRLIYRKRSPKILNVGTTKCLLSGLQTGRFSGKESRLGLILLSSYLELIKNNIVLCCGAHGNFPLLRALLNLLKGKFRP